MHVLSSAGMNEPKEIKALLQIFTDPVEWDKAKWSGTVFLFDPDGAKKQIPGLGIGFADFEAGKQIFENWIKRVGHVDEFEEIRVSIIEGQLPDDKRDGYTVMISSNPDHTIRREQQTHPEFQPETVMLVSRMHRMNPAPGSQNLERFKKAVADFGFYRLFPAHVANHQIHDQDLSLYVEKREIHFTQAENLRSGEPEYAVLAKQTKDDLQMDEFDTIMEKYGNRPLREHFDSVDEINQFALQFYRDAAEIYDCFTRLKDFETNPSGYSLDDAPIIGLLVRIWKLLKETIRYHVENNAEFIAIFQRTLLETAVTATYLLKHDRSAVEDFRKCSYKDRLRILQDAKNGSAFSKTKAGQRLLRSVEKKMKLEGFSENDFAQQKKNRWKLQGKSFLDILKDVYGDQNTAQVNEHMYRCSFGIMSESVHCSWNDSMDWCLQRNEDDTFSIYPFFHPADIRYITPVLAFCNEPYALWLKRIGIDDRYYTMFLDWIGRQNWNLYLEFDRLYGDMEPA